MYVSNFYLIENQKMQSKFRARFCIPYDNFRELVHWVTIDPLFDRWCGKKCNNKRSSPVELLVLGLLRYLGRGWTFDDIEEATAISKEVHRVFFHKFIRFGSTELFSKFVVTPISVVDALTHMAEFSSAGLPGCIGSIDCPHIVTERCEYNLKNNHLGFKSANTTRTFNLTCNHRRRILHSTGGGPGRWNDQTMVRLDKFISGIRDGMMFADNKFELDSTDKESGAIVRTTYSGVYVICDNGYLDWSCTVPPYSMTSRCEEIRWSNWMESMRKDVECTFGILKGQWRLLKSGVRIWGVLKADDVWLTCCAMHNWLLDIDGFSGEWNDGVPISDWSGALGDLDYDGIPEDIPNAIARLSRNLDPRNYDSSGMGRGNDIVTDRLVDNEHVQQIVQNAVSNMNLSEFRRKLVKHYEIQFHRNALVWPKHNT